MAASGLASIAEAGAARGPPTVPARWALVLAGLEGVYRRRAGAITRTLPIDRFCFFERRTIDGQRYVDPGRHVQLAEDVTDV
jgi:hypothetical protein